MDAFLIWAVLALLVLVLAGLLMVYKKMSADNSARAFKWTDQNGVVHYSDQAPDGQNAKIISVDPNQNLVQGSPGASSETDAETKTTPAPAQPNAVNLKGPTTIDNASIQQLLQQVKAAAEAAKQRPTE